MPSDEFSVVHGKHLVDKQPAGVQRVWWGWGRLLRRPPWRWVRVGGPWPSKGGNVGCIYKQRIIVGPVEYRWWAPPFNEWKAQRDARVLGGEEHR